MGYAVIRDEKTGIVTYDSRLIELDSDQAIEIRFIDKKILDENTWMRDQGHTPDKASNPKLANLIATREQLIKMWSGYPHDIAPWPADDREERMIGMDKIEREYKRKVTDY